MDSEADGHHRNSGLNPWRARCGEIRSAGSEGGPGKRISRNANTAPRSDPYTEHRTGEGKLYLCAIKDVFSNRIVGYSIDSRMKSHLATTALSNAVGRRGEVAGCIFHTDYAEVCVKPRMGGDVLLRAGLLVDFSA
jgi:putative transposase